MTEGCRNLRNYRVFVYGLSDEDFIDVLNLVEERKAEVINRYEAKVWLSKNGMPPEAISFIEEEKTIKAMKILKDTGLKLHLCRAIVDQWRQDNGA